MEQLNKTASLWLLWDIAKTIGPAALVFAVVEISVVYILIVRWFKKLRKIKQPT